jgi:hypothetical protein
MHTQFQDGSQFGATIPATAKLEKKNNDTNVAAVENVIWCPGASRVVYKTELGRVTQGID